jgi:hypothetical protein
MNNLLDRIHWPQVGALAVVVGGTVTAIVLVPESKWEHIPWTAIGAGAAAVVAAVASAFQDALIKRKTTTAPATDPNPSSTTELPKE